MGGASCPALAAAVSNAGGLGMLALSWSSADDIRKEIRETRELTGRPFGVNLVLNWPQADRLAVCLEEGVPIISFFWGQAGPLIEIAHRGGAKVLHTIASADAARRAVDDGADVVSRPGLGGRGPRPRQGRHHGAGAGRRRSRSRDAGDCRRRNCRRPRTCRGDGSRSYRRVDRNALSRESRKPQFTRAIGIFSSRRKRLTPNTALLFDRQVGRTRLTGLFATPHSNEWQRAGRPARVETDQAEGDIVAKSSAGDERPALRVLHARALNGAATSTRLSLWAGQGVGLVRRIQPAAEIVREIAEEAQKPTLTRLGSTAQFLRRGC